MKFITIVSFAIVVVSSTCRVNGALTFGPDFAGHYTSAVLGTPPGVPAPLGGLTLLAGDANTLLIGGSANNPVTGTIYAIGVTRDIDGHINGFSGTANVHSTAPYIDGGLTYGPSGVLMYTEFNINRIGQIKPGSSSPSRHDAVIGLTGSVSVGSMAFVPAGFSGAGQLKIVTYTGGQFATLPISPAGDGTYNLGTAALDVTLTGGPEGIAYVGGNNTGFGVNSLLVAEYDLGSIGTYAVDGSGNPILASRREFISGLTGVEGAFIDPLTGDFLFTSFQAGSEVFVVRGFVPAPEPSSFILWACVAGAGASAGIGARGIAKRFRRRRLR